MEFFIGDLTSFILLNILFTGGMLLSMILYLLVFIFIPLSIVKYNYQKKINDLLNHKITYKEIRKNNKFKNLEWINILKYIVIIAIFICEIVAYIKRGDSVLLIFLEAVPILLTVTIILQFLIEIFTYKRYYKEITKNSNQTSTEKYE